MQRIQTSARFAADGSVTLKAPGMAVPGEHPVTLVLEDESSGIPDFSVLSQAALAKVWDNPEDSIYDLAHI
jgi:hypothetical protein